MKSNGGPSLKKLKTNSPAAAAPSKVIKYSLPHDITTEILYKLVPAADFVRFRCVSKFFNSILNDAQLIHKLSIVQKPENQNQKLLFKLSSKSNNLFYVLDPKNTTKLENHCFSEFSYNGMSSGAVVTCNGWLSTYDSARNTFLCYNPLTKEEKQVRAFLNGKVPQFLGFGYDPSSKDYKIVVGVWLKSEPLMFLQIFSLRDQYWKVIEEEICAKFKPEGEAVYILGNLYWTAVETSSRCGLCENKQHNYHDHSKGLIVKFNLFWEEFSDIALPNYYKYKKLIHVAGIAELNGRLWATLNYLWDMTTDVWCMEKSDSWVRLVTLNLHYDFDFKSRFRLICCTENGSIVFQRSNKCLEIYDLKNKSWSVSEFPKDFEMEWKVNYQETNVSLDDEVRSNLLFLGVDYPV